MKHRMAINDYYRSANLGYLWAVHSAGAFCTSFKCYTIRFTTDFLQLFGAAKLGSYSRTGLW